MTDGMILDATVFIAIGTALTSAVVFLYKSQTARWVSADKAAEARATISDEKHAECERKHEVNQQKMLKMSEDLGELKGEMRTIKLLEPKLNDIHRILELWQASDALPNPPKNL